MPSYTYGRLYVVTAGKAGVIQENQSSQRRNEKGVGEREKKGVEGDLDTGSTPRPGEKPQSVNISLSNQLMSMAIS